MANRFSEDAFKAAQIAATLAIGSEVDEEPTWEEMAEWAVKLLDACERALRKPQ